MCHRAATKRHKPDTSHPVDAFLQQYREYLLYNPIEAYEYGASDVSVNLEGPLTCYFEAQRCEGCKAIEDDTFINVCGKCSNKLLLWLVLLLR